MTFKKVTRLKSSNNWENNSQKHDPNESSKNRPRIVQILALPFQKEKLKIFWRRWKWILILIHRVRRNLLVENILKCLTDRNRKMFCCPNKNCRQMISNVTNQIIWLHANRSKKHIIYLGKSFLDSFLGTNYVKGFFNNLFLIEILN